MAQWVTREYRCSNGIVEKIKYAIRENDAGRAGTRRFERAAKRAEKLTAEAKTNLARILNENFRVGVDCHVLLELDEAGYEKIVSRSGGEDPDGMLEALKRELVKAIRRARNAEDDVRYVAVISDMDGNTGELVRPHVHMVCNEAAAEAMRKKWKLGYVGIRTLYSREKHGDLTELADYMLAQVRKIGGEKRYIPSRNLRKPMVTAPRPAKNPDAELRVPKGCEYIWRSEQYAGRPQCLRYWKPETAAGGAA